MITKENTLSVSTLRQNTAEVLEKVDQTDKPLYIFRRSEPAAVLLDIDHFNFLEGILEDFLDSQELLSVSEKEVGKAASWKDFKKKLSL